MYKVLAVDDEPMMLDMWRSMVDWRSCGYELSGTATDGEEALAAIRKEEPDLVVTDIRMPVLDGLGLVRAMKEELGARSKIVIVSGYAEFEYAKKALRYGVDQYLLKPIEAEPFRGLLLELAASLDARRRAEATSGSAMAAAASSAIVRLLRSGTPPAADTVERLLGTNGRTRYRLLLAEAVSGPDGSGSDLREVSARLRALAETRFAGRIRCWLFDDPPRMAGLLAAEEDPFGTPLETLLLEAAADWLPLDYGVYCSGSAEGIAAWPELYRQALDARSRSMLADRRTGVHMYCPSASADSRPWEGVAAGAEPLLRAVEEGDPERVRQSAGRLFRQLDDSGACVALRYISGELIRKFADLPGLADAVARTELSLAERKADLDARQARDATERICGQAMKALAERKPAAGACSAAIREAIAHLKRHYREKARLNEFADRYHLNPVYFGQQFKRVTGLAFNDFVHRLRVEEARRLLTWTDMKVSDIALNLGYHDTEYFTTKFKTLTGERPSDYRNRIRREPHADPTVRYS